MFFFIIYIAVAPEITEHPPAITETVNGRNLTIKCRVFGAPKPHVTWIKEGRELTGGRFFINETGDLHIEGVTFADAAQYTCHASNKLGSESANGMVMVKGMK